MAPWSTRLAGRVAGSAFTAAFSNWNPDTDASAVVFCDHPSHWDAWLALAVTGSVNMEFRMLTHEDTVFRTPLYRRLGYVPLPVADRVRAADVLVRQATWVNARGNRVLWTAAPGQLMRTSAVSRLPRGNAELASLSNTSLYAVSFSYELLGQLRPYVWLNFKPLPPVQVESEWLDTLAETLRAASRELADASPGFSEHFSRFHGKRSVLIDDVPVPLKQLEAFMSYEPAIDTQYGWSVDPTQTAAVQRRFGRRIAHALRAGTFRVT